MVDDDDIEVEIITRAFRGSHITNHLDKASDGEEALSYLKEGKNPCLILLDLNMPKMNGFEFLKAAKQQNLLKHIPVIVLTTSTSKKDISEAFALGAAGYMIKPVNFSRFLELVKTIDRYWSASELPD